MDEKNYKSDGSTYNLYRDGLKIYTTIDSVAADHIGEESVSEHMKNLQKEFFNQNTEKRLIRQPIS